MKTTPTETGRLRGRSRGVLTAFVVAAALGLAAAPVLADNDDNRGHDNGHGKKHHGPPPQARNEYRGPEYRSYNYYEGGRYYAAPPPVVYAPVAPPALEFVFPLTFR